MKHETEPNILGSAPPECACDPEDVGSMGHARECPRFVEPALETLIKLAAFAGMCTCAGREGYDEICSLLESLPTHIRSRIGRDNGVRK